MMKLLPTILLSLASVSALADKYGVDESMSEGEASWSGVALTLVVLAYLHFKGK